MRKFVYISGALFTALTLLSVMFKILHLQGAGTLLAVGMGGLAVVFIPAFAIYHYRRSR